MSREDPDADRRGRLRDPDGLPKTVFWLTLAAPGIWLALRMPTRGDYGEGYLQLAIMGAALVVAAVVTELAWHVAGPGGRDLLRAAAFLLPVVAVGGILLVQAAVRSDVTIDTPPLPFERFGWRLLGIVVAVLALRYLVRRISSRR